MVKKWVPPGTRKSERNWPAMHARNGCGCNPAYSLLLVADTKEAFPMYKPFFVYTRSGPKMKYTPRVPLLGEGKSSHLPGSIAIMLFWNCSIAFQVCKSETPLTKSGVRCLPENPAQLPNNMNKPLSFVLTPMK